VSNNLLIEIMRRRYGDRLEDFMIPPPSFLAMDGDFVEIDEAGGWLITRFPVREAYMNPYGSMQGGFIAAAVDNTLGPLSMVIAPPNVTRRLDLKYSRAITIEMDEIFVRADFLGQDGRWLEFKAEVRSPEQELLARARALHWIVETP
jgi:acyl-coenzyme A thioesterase PaaI-like protein